MSTQSSPTVHLDASVAFTLGEDHAYYAVAKPSAMTADFERGFTHGVDRFNGPRKDANRFVRKWLQLRIGAWRRNRKFEPDVTPEFLEIIDMKHCPVSGVALTHGTGQLSDCSIDRVYNDGAYARGNLAAMSSRVNGIKGAKSLREIVEMKVGEPSATLLSDAERNRLVVLMGFLLPMGSVVRPVWPDAETPLYLPMHPSQTLQRTVWTCLSQPARARIFFWSYLEQGLGDPSREALNRLKQAVSTSCKNRKVLALDPYELFSDEALWSAMRDFWSAAYLETEFEGRIDEMMSIFPATGQEVADGAWPEMVSAHTKGYC